MKFISNLKRAASNKDGVALLHLGIILMIIGLLIVFGIKALGPLLQREKHIDTKDIINAGIDAVAGFAVTNGRIPTVAEFANIARNPKDIWGNDLVYIPDPGLTSGDPICDRNTTDTHVQNCGGDASCASPSAIIDNVAFVIVSGGDNFNMQTNVASSTINTYDYDLIGIDDYASGLNRPENYSDIVLWMELSELKARVGCGTGIKIINSSLPYGVVTNAYNVFVYAEGGVLFADGADSDPDEDYRWCVQEDPQAGLNILCDGNLVSSVSCSWDEVTSTETGTWQSCTSIQVSGTPTQVSTMYIPVYVRDDDNNIANKTFPLSIIPLPGLHICTEYRVWNSMGNKKDFMLDGACLQVNDGDEVTTDGTRTLSQNEVIYQYGTSNGNCNNQQLLATYNQAILTDINADCCIGFTPNDPPDYTIFEDSNCVAAGDPCEATGINVLNSTGSNVRFKIQPGVNCSDWGSGVGNSVNAGNTLKTYGTSGACNSQTCSKGYTDLRSYDIDNGCDIEITNLGSCSFSDN
ncbi:MAG: hypothetical protein HY807_01225 [Nitrospirae bacterium]|nr:hypothetical protein [Nitrospirota bacterium]